MPRHKADVITQREQLFSDRVNQLLVIAHREIGPADRACEDHIPYPRQLSFAVQKHHVPGRMPGQ